MTAALEGRLLTADEARRAYEEIVRRQRDPALLEYLGRDLYRVSVFPIPAGQSRKVRLRYEQVLAADGGTYECATRSTPRSSARSRSRTSRVHGGHPCRRAHRTRLQPHARRRRARPERNRAQASFESRNVRPDTDFLLYWSLSRNDVGASLLTWWPKDEDRGYFLFLASPALPDGAARAAKPKQITFVVDTSGSMSGDKMEQARAALRQVIGGLNDGDQFNVIAYDTGVRPLWAGPQALRRSHARRGARVRRGLEGHGRDEHRGRATAALAPGRPRACPARSCS